jgi:metal-dependent HD superfamily phosphatase/phosphodiesterase
MKRAVVIFTFLMAASACAASRAADAPDAAMSEAKIMPKKAQVDANFNGKVDRVEIYDASGNPVEIDVDANEDGVFEEQIFYRDGKLVKSARDSNNDGKVDVWVEY